MGHKVDVLARRCETEDRDPATIRKTILGGGNTIDDTDAFLASMQEYVDLGVDLVEVMPTTSDPLAEFSELCEKVVPQWPRSARRSRATVVPT